MWTVTRQKPYYQPGINLVEISRGGIDYTGSDALCAKFPGEFESFDSLVEAMNTAIAIRSAWNDVIRQANIRAKQIGWNGGLNYASTRQRLARIGIGDTGGMGLEIEPSDMTDRQLRALAKRIDDAAPKCPHCGGFMSDDSRKRWQANDWDGTEYCSEHCAQRVAEFEAQLDNEEN